MLRESNEAKKGGVKNKQGLYAAAAAHSKEAIDVLVKLMRSRNENVSLGAAKAILAKTIPDLKAVEADVKSSEPIEIILVPDMGGGYIPPTS